MPLSVEDDITYEPADAACNVRLELAGVILRSAGALHVFVYVFGG